MLSQESDPTSRVFGITVGVFSLLQIDFDLTVLAALLAVIGY
jgi:preprotein translocase subunit SecF